MRCCSKHVAERFPNRRTPHHTTYAAVDERLREIGAFKKASGHSARSCQLAIENEEQILDVIKENPSDSVRSLPKRFDHLFIEFCKTSSYGCPRFTRRKSSSLNRILRIVH